MRDERPIVFTITDLGNKNYKIITKDPRGKDYNKVRTQALFYGIRTITEELNEKGYAVLFEVD